MKAEMNLKLLFLSLLASISACLSAESTFEKDRILMIDHLHEVLFDPQAKAPLENFQPDGTWSDLNYKDRSRGHWNPRQHLSRMKEMASSRPDLALKALQGWLKKNPVSPNWWWNCIGIPQAVCETIFLIRPQNVPADLLKKVEPMIRKSYNFFRRKKMTGQNLVWVEEIRIYAGLLYNEHSLVREGHSKILSELRIAPLGKEGLQSDYSFHQHGPQNQVGNYGLSFLRCQIRWAHILKGTQFAYSPEQIRILDLFFSNCIRWTLSDGIMDYNFCGRQLWHKAPAGKYRECLSFCREMIPLLPELRRDEYEKTLKDPDSLTGVAVFPRSACLIYRSPEGWLFSLKMSGQNLKGSETVNFENMQGRYQGDGVTFFGRMSRYNGYPALFDQRMLPGTTEVRNQGPLDADRNIHNANGSYALLAEFPVALAAMRLNAEEIRADKVWFCTPSGVTCAGSGIVSETNDPVVTIVDQYRLDSEKEFPVEAVGEGIKRVVAKRNGNWKDSFKEFPSEIITGDVVTLLIDHGVRPDHAGYRYILRKKGVPAENETRLQTSSKRIHALASKDHILTAAFEKGTVSLPDGKKLNVKPGIAIWKRDGSLLKHADFTER